MNTWLNHSPFLAVGIYISGDSRACRNQPNLTAAWVAHPAPQGLAAAADHARPAGVVQPRFPRYKDDVTIKPEPGKANDYSIARGQGTAEAGKAVAAAQALGIVPGSTLWYDLEGFDLGNTACRESALAVPQRLDHAAARARLRVRRLLQRRLRHQDARRRPGQPARRRSRCPTGSGWPAGTAIANTSSSVHPRRRLAPGRPREAVPAAATTRPGAASGSTSTATSSTSARARSRAPRPTAAASGSNFYRLRTPCAPREQATRRRPPGQGAAVPAQGAGPLRRQGQRQVQRAAARRRAGLAGAHGLPRPAGLDAAELGEPVRRRRPARSSSSARPAPDVRRVQRALNAANADADAVSDRDVRPRDRQGAAGVPEEGRPRPSPASTTGPPGGSCEAGRR